MRDCRLVMRHHRLEKRGYRLVRQHHRLERMVNRHHHFHRLGKMKYSEEIPAAHIVVMLANNYPTHKQEKSRDTDPVQWTHSDRLPYHSFRHTYPEHVDQERT